MPPVFAVPEYALIDAPFVPIVTTTFSPPFKPVIYLTAIPPLPPREPYNRLGETAKPPPPPTQVTFKFLIPCGTVYVVLDVICVIS